MTKTVGYEIEVVFGFFDTVGEKRDDEQFGALNEIRVNDSTRALFKRWLAGRDVIPLAKVDEILLRHGLMLWELEDWAEATLGRTGFVDPYTEPKELVG